MKIFELHFNPKKQKFNFFKKDKTPFFNSFCCSQEKKHLIMLGEAVNTEIKPQELLNQTAQIIQEEYFKPQKDPQENALNPPLVLINEFLLENLTPKNPNFIFQFNFAILSLIENEFDDYYKIELAQTGNLKIVLLSQDQIFEINPKAQSPTAETSANTDEIIFPNIIEGTLLRGDKILIVTEYLFNVLKEWQIIEQIGLQKKPRAFKKFLKNEKQNLRRITGGCVIIFTKKKSFFAKLNFFINWARKTTPKTRQIIIALFALLLTLLIARVFF